MQFPWQRWVSIKWLYPGMGIKRWLLLLAVGITLVSLGAAYLLTDIYRQQPLPRVFYYLTLQFIPRLYRALLFGLLGLSAVVIAVFRLNVSLLSVFLQPGQENLADLVYQQRQRERGPRIVAIGGGTGLSTVLRGLKGYTTRLTAIVTVADDGGSSGRLRRALGVLPPGDLRNCIASLADAESLMAQLFQYRFGGGVELNGHSFGNLFIVAMAAITGSFERAVEESSRVLAVRGRILPSTLEDVTLCAEVVEGESEASQQIEGESSIPAAGLPIERVFLRPETVHGYPEAVKAILEADLIAIGPGSLYTSVLPNLLVSDITSAIRTSQALKVFVCNVATQPGETDGYSASRHVDAVARHVGPQLCDFVLANDHIDRQLYIGSKSEWVLPDGVPPGEGTLLTSDLVDHDNPWRHNPEKLARALIRLCQERKDS
jgi:uncharacterized cofD-like protein